MDTDLTDWVSILAGGQSGPEYVVVTPERVASLCLTDSVEQLEKSQASVMRLALAAKSAHLALQAALTAALAGSANIGAHPEKLQARYIQYFEESRTTPLAPPESDRVMGFSELLNAARSEPLPWSNAPLVLSDSEVELLERLTKVRHAVEHPKQMHHSIEQKYVLEVLPLAAKISVILLETVSHHLESGEIERLRACVDKIDELCELGIQTQS